MIHRHHTLFDKAAWTSSDSRKDLRNIQWLIPPIREEQHRLLHINIEGVPVPGYATMARIRREYEPMPSDYIGSMARFMVATENALRHPKTTELQKALGALTIQAMAEQIPFVREGLAWGKQGRAA